MRYTWDDEKAAQNERKHRVDFATASLVFSDPNRIDDYDFGHSENEDRWVTIGLANTMVLFVVSIERAENVIRIISARKATKNERQAYYQINH